MQESINRGGGVKTYYIYGNNITKRNPHSHPTGNIKEEHRVYQRVKHVLMQAEYDRIEEYKIKPLSDFKNIWVYREKLKASEVARYELTYIGHAKDLSGARCMLPTMVLLMNDDLRADTVNLELTDVECTNLLKSFTDYQMYGMIHSSKDKAQGDYNMAMRTLTKIRKALPDDTEYDLP